MQETGQQRFLILGGPPRTASTSLFEHLAAHPRICPAERKETGALLDPDYVLWSEKGIITAGQSTVLALDEYYRSYPAWPDRRFTYMEASTDYLYSPGTARRIQSLGDARVVFVLREPIGRMVSMYRFSLQRGWLLDLPSLEQYIRRQLATPEQGGLAPPLLALARGRYAPWLRGYIEALGREKVHVAFFEELIREPASTVAGICRSSGLDPEPLARLPFGRRNDSYAPRSVHLHRWIEAARASARRLARRFPATEGAKRRLWGAFRPAYRRINTRSPQPLSSPLRRALESYYAEDRGALEHLLGRSVPWPAHGGSERAAG